MEGEIYKLVFRGDPPLFVVVNANDYRQYGIAEKRKKIIEYYEGVLDSSHLIHKVEFIKRVKIR